MRSKSACKTLFKAALQSAGFTRHSALQCRAACGPRKNLRPSSSKYRCGRRSREKRLQLHARFATEAQHSNCYANTNSNSDPKTITNANTNSDPNRDRNSNIYADAHGDIHADCHSDIHTDSHRVIHSDTHRVIHTDSHGDIHTDSDSDRHSNPDSNLNVCASRGLFFYSQRRPTLGPGLSQS